MQNGASKLTVVSTSFTRLIINFFVCLRTALILWETNETALTWCISIYCKVRVMAWSCACV